MQKTPVVGNRTLAFSGEAAVVHLQGNDPTLNIKSKISRIKRTGNQSFSYKLRVFCKIAS